MIFGHRHFIFSIRYFVKNIPSTLIVIIKMISLLHWLSVDISFTLGVLKRNNTLFGDIADLLRNSNWLNFFLLLLLFGVFAFVLDLFQKVHYYYEWRIIITLATYLFKIEEIGRAHV